MVGDFNIHVDDSSDSDTITFMDLLDSYNMLNKVTFPTHVKHYSLDLVIEDRNNTVVTNVKEGLFLSDHCFVHSTLDIITPKPKECVLTFRKLKSIDHLVIINLSLLTGNMPQNMKEALLRPLLKKPNLDLQQFKNFRPVSNLSFDSKLIERAVCDQLLEYTATTGKLDGMQSAYRADHSTETALLKVKTDILNDMDNKKVNFLMLLDLSATFDTVSFHLLMNRLLNRFGITGTVLKWIESYLTEQTQKSND